MTRIVAGVKGLHMSQGMMVLRILVAFVAAVAITEVVAASASTQFVLAALADLGVSIPLSDRIATTAHDIVGMASIYAPIIAVGFLIAFPVAALVIHYALPLWHRLGYALAGFVAMITALAIMIALFDVTPIAGARSAAGFICQGLAGAAGGYVFASLARRPAS